MTIEDLAAELGVPKEDVEAIVDQLAAIDGDGATIAQAEPVTNGSGRHVGYAITLTPAAAEAVRLQFTESRK